MKITLSSDGDWKETKKFLTKNKNLSEKARAILIRAAEEGLAALERETPKYTGLASSSWSYDIEVGRYSSTITWSNHDIEGGYNVAILVQYGHGVKGGGYIEGRDFINPAIRPIFDNFIETLWREVTS